VFVFAQMAGGVIVSCQARPDNPLHGPIFMAAMAVAAEQGGAVGIRAEGAADIAAIRAAVPLPILGIRKILDGRPAYITPTFDTAREVRDAGADLLALDASLRDRAGGPTPAELIAFTHDELGLPVMADCDDLASAEAAAAAGADIVSTTLAGYTGGPVPREPDLDLIARMVRAVDVPVVAEGRLWTPEDVSAAFHAGAWAVVVGTAVTNPMRITARLVDATPARRNISSASR
jgi:putative N-acetylmannosamine-6-phosphate epimerase